MQTLIFSNKQLTKSINFVRSRNIAFKSLSMKNCRNVITIIAMEAIAKKTGFASLYGITVLVDDAMANPGNDKYYVDVSVSLTVSDPESFSEEDIYTV